MISWCLNVAVDIGEYEPERAGRAELARARDEGKRLGRPPIAPELERRIREALAKPGRPGECARSLSGSGLTRARCKGLAALSRGQARWPFSGAVQAIVAKPRQNGVSTNGTAAKRKDPDALFPPRRGLLT
jgi:hypothetical protein